MFTIAIATNDLRNQEINDLTLSKKTSEKDTRFLTSITMQHITIRSKPYNPCFSLYLFPGFNPARLAVFVKAPLMLPGTRAVQNGSSAWISHPHPMFAKCVWRLKTPA
ncbi:hypothetical protein PoB_000296700 [Plakobranchus ocellatus]|uniref:Uncharacterized protein n=1 Tax=Plakobranchus ocellatus TaxID=259542 RepID=A0AAV3Y313_9GAST|nr:hypothetical protein PoB_000296700 [Plakobranchus ocellatus]